MIEEFKKLTMNFISEEELVISKGHIVGELFCNIQTGLDFTNWYGIQELMVDKSLSLEQQAEIYKNNYIIYIYWVHHRYLLQSLFMV